MSGIKELRDGLAKKMSAMKEKQGKSELTNPSMAEGVNEKAYGLRKKVVTELYCFWSVRS